MQRPTSWATIKTDAPLHEERRTTQLSAPVPERNTNKWVKLRSSMSCPELRSHLRAEARGVA